MKIISLKLLNFQGIKDKEFDFDGHNASIFGDNGTGKTTVYNAFTWLLTGNASTGAKGYSPKTVDEHGLEHSAEATFVSEDGEKIAFKKSYHEVYRKKRGSVSEDFTGHATDYFINGVPAKEKDFNEKVEEVFGDSEQVKILTIPFYFSEALKWDERRKILLSICGDVTDSEVIEKTEELKELPEILGNHSVEDFKKIATERKKDLNKQIDSIPARMDEAMRAIVEVAEPEEELKKEKASSEKTLEKLTQKKSDLLTGSTAESERRKAISEKEAEIESARAKYIQKRNQEISEAMTKMLTARKKTSDADHEYGQMLRKVDDLADEIAYMTEERERLAEKYREEAKKEWDEKNDCCPTCGQRLPEENLLELREAFNIEKSETLEAIRGEGKKVSADKIKEKQEELTRLMGQAESKKKEFDSCMEELKKSEVTPKSMLFEDTALYKALKNDLEELTNKPGDENTGVGAELSRIQAEITTEQEKLDGINGKLLAIESASKQKARIAELKSQQKEMAEMYEKTEKELYLCEQFIKAKVSMLDSQINSRFKNVRFRLFTEQINGGIKDDCEVLVPCGDRLIPYRDANNASRINAGLEIIHTLGKAWGKEIPVWIDNAESVVRLNEYKETQMIRLVVSAEDSTLRTEILEKEK